MDGRLVFLIQILMVFKLKGVVLACLSAEQFSEDCLTPYNNYRVGEGFWENVCSLLAITKTMPFAIPVSSDCLESQLGLKVLECIKLQHEEDCPVVNEEQSQLFSNFEERFGLYNMSIDYACEQQNNVSCREINGCFPVDIFTFNGSTVFSFYEYLCGDQYMQHMFTCMEEFAIECPASVMELKQVFQITTPSETLDFDMLMAKVPVECGKLLDSDVNCIQIKDAELATCEINPVIDIPEGTIICEYSDLSRQCVQGKCGGTVATFLDEIFTFLECGLNIDGSWSEWSLWSACTLTCGQGTHIRSRQCNNPVPAGNGKYCEGNYIEVDDCDAGNCPVDGAFSLWGFWSECSQSCDGGSRLRTRDCNSPSPAYGGNNCTGEYTQSENCNEQGCPVNGGYSEWSTWGTCSGQETCGAGVQTRSRTCDEPLPSNGGSDCMQPNTEEKICYIGDCPVNGGFSDWSMWSVCSKTCGGGMQMRTRACDNPVPYNGGSDCNGETSQNKACNSQQCPVTSCPEVTDAYGRWQETSVDLTVTLQCMKTEEEGSYSRKCKVNGMWGEVSGKCEIKQDVFNELNSKLQELSNSEGDITEEAENIVKNLTSMSENVDSTTSGETLERFVDSAQNFVNVVQSSKSISETGSQLFFELTSNIIKPETEPVWNDDQTDVKGSDVLNMVDRYVAVVQDTKCDTLNNDGISNYDNANLYVEIGKVQGSVQYPSLKQDGSFIEISADALSKKGLTDVCFGGTSYTSVGDIVEEYISVDGSTISFADGQKINSKVVSMQLPASPGVSYNDFSPPVRITLKPKNMSLSEPVCVFWDYSFIDSGRNGAWSSRDCQLAKYQGDNIICECSHLTNFAVLMSPSQISEKHSDILSIVSAIGCAISMVCLILTLAVHALVWRLVRSDRVIILMNLCVALLLALGVFLAGVNRTESPKACAAIAAIIQLLFLAVFFFMLLIGLEILICVVHVFVTKFRIKILLPVAWLAPVMIVGISLGVTKTEGYGNNRFCWLDIDSGLIWSFLGPVALIIFVNFLIILVVFKKMASSSVLKSKSAAQKIQTGVRSLCVLLPLMGLTWVFGLLSVNSSFVFFQYLFCICNTLQGLFIFLFHCVFNRQVKEAIKRRRDRRRSLQTFSSDLRKQSRSLSKDMMPKTPFSETASSDQILKGVDNKAYTGRNKRARTRSNDYRVDDWDKLERKKYHKNIRRGSKLTA